MKKQTVDEALSTIVRDAMRPSGTKTGYKRVLRALKTLGIDPADIPEAMCWLSYHKLDGTPREWLSEDRK